MHVKRQVCLVFFLWNAGHSCRLVPKSALRSKAKAKSLKFNIKKIIFQFHSYKNNYPIDSDGEKNKTEMDWP